MARLAAFHKYGKGKVKLTAGNIGQTAPLRETASSTEKPGKHSALNRGSKFNAVRSRVWQG